MCNRNRYIAAVAVLLALSGPGAAADTMIAASEEDHFSAGGSVELRELVAGDALLAGGSVESNAAVGGDLVAAGGDVAVRATVGSDLYVAGGQVMIDALVGGSARIAGARVRVAPQSRIEGGLAVAGGSVSVDGRLGRYLVIAGRDVTLGGEIAGDVHVYAQSLRVLGGTRIGGQLVYRSDEPLVLPPDVEIAEGVVREDGREGEAAQRAWRQDAERMGRGFAWAWLAGLLAVGLLLVFTLVAFSRRVTQVVRERPWFAIILGFGVLACGPALIIALSMTLVGIPLALILLLLYLAMLIGAYVVGALYLGDRALEAAHAGPGTPWRRLGALFLVLIALALAGAVPVLGDIARFAVLLLGLGGIVLVAWAGAAGRGGPAA
ncbi:MAG: hypothetical protein L6Q83_00310 [Gammaproteobacteria bacterium]|nr:hypothetical protein [Gammaproteobacteria bacterium]